MTIHQIAQCLDLKPERVDRLGAYRHSVDVRCAKVAMAEAVERLATLESALCRSNLPNFTCEVAGVRAMLVAALESGRQP